MPRASPARTATTFRRRPAPGAGATRPGPTRTRIGPRRSTTTPCIRLADDGWRGYEISNWARPGHESRHNLAYWQRRPYEAVGPGRPRLRRRDAALERRPARRLRGRAPTRRRRREPVLPPGRMPSRSTQATPPPRRRSSALRLDTGLPLRPRRDRRSTRGSAGRSRPSCSRSTESRADRPDDPRPAAVERALRAAGLSQSSDRSGSERGRMARRPR